MQQKKSINKVSIVTTVYNEEDNLKILYQELKSVLNKLNILYEFIFVDDGSIDKSITILEHLAKKNKRIKVLGFKRNYGQTAAISAGIKQASGDVIILIDSDLQNDPNDIPKLLSYINKGYDVVSGWRVKRKDSFIKKILPSFIANIIISKLIGVKLHDYGCTLKAYRKSILNKFTLYGEMHRLIPAYTAMMGAKIIEVPVNHRIRQFGRSHYGLARIVNLLFDLLTIKFINDFSTKPLYLFGSIGLSIFSFGVIIFIVVTVRVIFFSGGWISPMILLSGLMIILSFQFILIGLLAEIIIRIYFESQKKQPYVISKTINL